MRRMRCACWITKAIDIHSEYEILIAFPAATMGTRTRFNIYDIMHCWSCMGMLEATILLA